MDYQDSPYITLYEIKRRFSVPLVERWLSRDRGGEVRVHGQPAWPRREFRMVAGDIVCGGGWLWDDFVAFEGLFDAEECAEQDLPCHPPTKVLNGDNPVVGLMSAFRVAMKLCKKGELQIDPDTGAVIGRLRAGQTLTLS